MSGQVAQPHDQQQPAPVAGGKFGASPCRTNLEPTRGALNSGNTSESRGNSRNRCSVVEQPSNGAAAADLKSGESPAFNGGLRRAAGAERRLSVVLPQIQKSLLTPTIVTQEQPGATPSQLFSSLIQLNGQEVSLFTGLPSCTPTSADALACTGINPFFWGVTPFNQQKSPQVASMDQQQQLSNGDSDQNQPNANYQTQANNYITSENYQQQQQQQAAGQMPMGKSAAEEKERRRQLSKLSIDQLQAANVILTSPLSFLLSPENEHWFRLGLQNHPLSGKSAFASASCCSTSEKHHHQQRQATDGPARPDQNGAEHNHLGPNSAYHGSQNQAAQDLTSNAPQVAVSSHRLDGSTANTCAASISSNQPTAYLQQTSPIFGQAYAGTCALSATGYNGQCMQQQPIAAPVASSNPCAGQAPHLRTFHQQQNAQQAPNVVGQNSPIGETGRVAIVIERSNEREAHHRGQENRANHSMGPPAAHHQQLPQQPQAHHHHHHHHHNQNALLVMNPHQLDSRFVEFHHQQQQQHQPQHPVARAGQTLQALHYDGAKQPIGLYDPHLQQLYLAQHQQHQQEIYTLHQQQQQQQQHNPSFMQQTVPTYQPAPVATSGQVPLAQQQQPPPPPLQDSFSQTNEPVARYRPEVGPGHDATTDNRSTSNPSPKVNDHSSNTNYMDSSSNSSSSSSSGSSTNSFSGSNSVSSRRFDLSIQSSNNPSSVRSSVSRDTNSIDVIATAAESRLTNGRSASLLSDSSLQVESRGSTTTTTTTTKSTTTTSTKQTSAPKQTAASKKAAEKREPVESTNSTGEVVKKKSKGGRKKKVVTHEEMLARKNRSKERNRVAAKRCRQKRKQFLDELRGRIDNLNDSNKKLLRENNQLKVELEQLRNHHKICTI